VKFLEGEHPQTIAVVLAHVGVELASSVLPLLPDTVQADVIKRLARMQQFSGEMLKKVSLVLQKKLAASAKQSRRSLGGVTAAAGTLNRMDPKSCKLILDTLQNSDPDLAETIRDQMFTFDDLGSLLAVSLREILAELDKKTLAMALKGAREEVRTVFYNSMSSRAAEMLREDMEALGPLRLHQVQQAQKDVVALARKLEAEGKISLKSGGDDGYVD
jgi:flagellar motor switch protein FliG